LSPTITRRRPIAPPRSSRRTDYKLRASGHRRQVVEHNGRTTTYSYDDLYRLTGESVAAGAADPVPSGAITYDLDKVGNRLNRVSTMAAIVSQLAESYNARDWRAGDSYTANGSTLTSSQLLVTPEPGGGGSALNPQLSGTDTYDFEERLIIRTKPDGSTINVSYDADGNRFQKTLLDAAAAVTSSTAYLVDTNNLTGYAQVVEERTTTGGATPSTTRGVYTYGTSLISQTSQLQTPNTELQTRYYAFDGHGSVRELTDASGAVTDSYTYDAFGVLVHRSGTTPNAYLYCGEQFDADLGLYFLRARYLNPDSGRFWSMDSYEGLLDEPQSLHRCVYAAANPVSAHDPSGRMTLVETMGPVATTGTLAKIAVVASVYVVSRALVQNYDSASALVREIAARALKSRGSALIGESMERVDWAQANVYPLADKLPDLSEYGLSVAAMFPVNAAWIRNKMARGFLIIDIGYDPDRFTRGKERGIFYTMELGWTYGYWNRISDPTIPGSLHLK
jgi:RHS repeat-associated protein